MKEFENLSDVELLTLCIYGEARNQGLEGMTAVGLVVMNRARHPRWWGNDVRSVILKDTLPDRPGGEQFSCFMEGDSNRPILEGIAEDFASHMDRAVFAACYWIARGIIEGHLHSGAIRNDVGRATHYHTRTSSPAWKGKLRYITTVGDHLFYEEV